MVVFVGLLVSCVFWFGFVLSWCCGLRCLLFGFWLWLCVLFVTLVFDVCLWFGFALVLLVG